MPPNILLILTDQHSPHIAGFAGNDKVQTRALDRLAARSTRFDAAYCQSPLCVPSRMSLWSGRYPHHCAAWDNRSVLHGMTIPRWLAQQGYTTAAVGKMHFRGEEQMHGFQERPYGDLVESTIPVHQPDPPDTADGRSSSHAVGRFPFAGASAIPESLQADRVVTTESLAWLLNHHTQRQPWFFCASYMRPHFPLTAPERYIRRYLEMDLPQPPLPEGYPEGLHPHDRFIVDDFGLTRFSPEEHRRALAGYYAALDYVDDCIGDILAGLEQAGCLDNTYIVYTADHGDMAGEHGLWWKRTYYEASARVPLLISGPGIQPGAVIDAPVELVDLFPTFCDWAEVAPPSKLDGESLTGLLNGGHREKHTALSEMLGERTETRFRMVRDARWKYVEFPSAPPRLFDLENDPDEWDDLWPEIPPEAPVDALRAHLPGEWDAIIRQRQAEYDQRPPFQPLSRAAVHYRLGDGRLIDADDHLYERTD
ncbi:MAG: sulfatase-like hydrolase/transferase [Anaerolineae bacterium]|nr:sulfatase-like hydrolase/transferase [Anaerolineae bacterium]